MIIMIINERNDDCNNNNNNNKIVIIFFLDFVLDIDIINFFRHKLIVIHHVNRKYI